MYINKELHEDENVNHCIKSLILYKTYHWQKQDKITPMH